MTQNYIDSKALITFTISDDNLRNELIKFLKEQEWGEYPDQSTMIYPLKNGIYTLSKLKMLKDFIKSEEWDKGDQIIINRAKRDENGMPYLQTEFLLGGD